MGNLYCMRFVELPLFTKTTKKIGMRASEVEKLKTELEGNPTKGDLIQQSGGLRKIRVASHGKGKSGGSRVIYYLSTPHEVILVMAYSKSQADTLTAEQINILRKIIKN